jgi:trigger factor
MSQPSFLPVPEVKYTQKSPILGEFKVTVHPSIMDQKLNAAYQRLQQKVALPGFRKGKAPLDIVKRKYEKDVRDDVFHELVNETYRKAAAEHKIPVAGDPYLVENNFANWQQGAKVEFITHVDLIPEVKLKKYKGLPITKKEAKIKEEDVEVVIKNLLEPRAELVNLPEDTKVNRGHHVVIDFEGTLDGVAVPDSSAKNFFLEVGAENSMEDFQRGLEGLTVGDERVIPVTYPKDYKNPDIAGKTMEYKVKLHEVKQKNLPELTDELAKEFGAETVAEFQTRVRKSLEDEMLQEQNQRSQEEVLLALLEANPLEIPPSLIQRQLRHILGEVSELLKRQKYNDKVVEDYFQKNFDEFKARAEREVKVALFLPKVIEQEKIETTEEDLTKHFEEVSKSSGQDLAAVEKFYKENTQRRDELKRDLQRRKAVQFLVDEAKVSSK